MFTFQITHKIARDTDQERILLLAFCERRGWQYTWCDTFQPAITAAMEAVTPSKRTVTFPSFPFAGSAQIPSRFPTLGECALASTWSDCHCPISSARSTIGTTGEVGIDR